MFLFYNPNPTGKNVGDCAVRALSRAMGKGWLSTYLGLCIEGALCGDMPSANAVWGAYLARNGFVRRLAPDGVTVGPISIAIALEGEPLGSATATVTPAAVGDEFNVSMSAYVDVPKGCCVTVSVKNVNAQTIELQNASMIVTRVC